MCKRLYIFCITIRFDYKAKFPLSFDEHLLYLCIMSNVIADMFRAALNFLLHQEGRGAQVRLATAQNIDRGYLNAVIKGRKPAAEEIRLKIANHFGMTYEAMLTLGRAVEEGTVLQGQGISQLGPSKDTQSGVDRLDRIRRERNPKPCSSFWRYSIPKPSTAPS